MFYTNVAQYGNSILYLGYDKHGKKVKLKIPYKPKLFLPAKTKNASYVTLDGVPLEPIEFDSISDARDFIKQYSDVSNMSIFGFTNWKYTFISEKFKKDVEYDLTKIKVMIIDIETKLPKDGFENFVEDAPSPVTAISIRMNDNILVFGYKEDYTPKDRKVRYIHCKDEYDMLGRFVEIYNSEAWQPDVISGWNVEFFDVPYLINRITHILGKDQASRLSPWKMLREKEVYSFGRDQQSYVPVGVSVLDYLQLYKKFTYNQQESFKLDHISHVELNEKKVDYSEYENLDDLYENDFEKYIDYNIHDVNLVYNLDQKLKLFDLIFIMSYDAKINYNDSLGSVLPWEVVIYNYLINRNIVMPAKTKHDKSTSYEGAYVKQPLIGLHDWVVSFDLTSLYPHLIIQYNISPETFIRKREGVTVDGILQGKIVNSTEFSMSANGCLYDRRRGGFLPALMKHFFAKRKAYKNKMLEYKKRKENGENVDNEISKYDNAQMAMKIFLNSAYGAIGNKYFTFYNEDNAEAITLSGQLSIRWVEKHINEYLNQKLGTQGEDYVIAMDTDSLYLNLGSLVTKFIDSKFDSSDNSTVNRSSSDLVISDRDSRITDILDDFSERVLRLEIDKAYADLAKVMNAYENAMFMKREAISSKGIWKAKKMYVLNVIDNEGVRYHSPEIKIMGIEAIKSSIPEVCRNALKHCIKLILNKDNSTLIDYIEKFRTEFYSMPFSDISFPRGVNGLEKYANKSTIYAKGSPIHVKGSLLYNHLLKQNNLALNPIYSGDKIRYAYLKVPNPIQEEVIASPGYLPKEFGLNDFIDKPKQFEKTFLDPLKSITDVIDWKIEDSHSIEDFY